MRVRRQAATAIAIATLIGGAFVFERRIPARIDVGSDTLIINGFQPVLVEARLINRHGDDVWRPGLQLSEEPGSIAQIPRFGPDDRYKKGDAFASPFLLP